MFNSYESHQPNATFQIASDPLFLHKLTDSTNGMALLDLNRTEAMSPNLTHSHQMLNLKIASV